jgi:hypothetical protein
MTVTHLQINPAFPCAPDIPPSPANLNSILIYQK